MTNLENPGEPGEPPPADGEPAGDAETTDTDQVESGEVEPGSRSEEVDRAQEREEDSPEG